MQEKKHYKLYKGGKQWLTALVCVAVLEIGGGVALADNNNNQPVQETNAVAKTSVQNTPTTPATNVQTDSQQATSVQQPTAAKDSSASIQRVIQPNGQQLRTNQNGIKEINYQIYDDPTQIVTNLHQPNETTSYGSLAKFLKDNSALGVSSIFHVFGNEAHLDAHVHGNIAVKRLDNNVNTGTVNKGTYITDGDTYYIEQLTSPINESSFNSKDDYVIFGTGVDALARDGQVYLKYNDQDHKMPNLGVNEVFNDPTDSYINIEKELAFLSEQSKQYSGKAQSAGVTFDFNDQNDRWIDVSKAKPDSNNCIYINVPFEYLQASQVIKIRGLSSHQDFDKNEIAPTIIANVTGLDKATEFNISTQTLLYYDDSNEPLNNKEDQQVPNHLLWNFGTGNQEFRFTGGRFMGSILAPQATIHGGVNIDGNIIADKIYIAGGESHRWDLFPTKPNLPFEEIVEPTEPTQPTEQPTKPTEPTQPTEQPTKPTEPTQPTEQPTKPTEPTQPTEQPTKPTEPTQPTEQPTKPTEPTQPTEQPTKPIEPTQPTEQPTQPIQPSDPTIDTPTEGENGAAVPPIVSEPSESVEGSSTMTPEFEMTQSSSQGGVGASTNQEDKNQQALPQTGNEDQAKASLGLIGVIAGALLSLFGIGGKKLSH